MSIPSNVYNFTDYRQFLKDRYHQLKECDPTFSFRVFSREAGFGSPNYLKLVMDGKRNLSEDAIAKFAKGIRLDRHESEYFRYLVLHNQAGNAQDQRVYEAKLSYLHELFKVKDVIPELYDFYHDWYHSTIYEMIKKGGVKNDPAWIGQQLVPTISAEQATESIELLKKLAFIEVTATGTIEATERTETIEPGVAQKIYQEQMAELAAQSVYTQTDGPGFESVTVSLPADKVAELKERIQHLVRDLREASTRNPGDAIYQVNMQLFALTEKKEEEKAVEAVAG